MILASPASFHVKPAVRQGRCHSSILEKARSIYKTLIAHESPLKAPLLPHSLIALKPAFQTTPSHHPSSSRLHPVPCQGMLAAHHSG